MSSTRSSKKYIRYGLFSSLQHRIGGKDNSITRLYIYVKFHVSLIEIIFIAFKIVDSSHGLLTTVAYQFGPDAQPVYALEGSVAIAGAVIQWLKENLGIISDVNDCESIVRQVYNDNRITFVPAFAGLYAPYWRKDARR